MKAFFLAGLLLVSGSVMADEDQEYCQHKYAQVAADQAYQQSGCDFLDSTIDQMNSNMVNTFANCSDKLSKSTMRRIQITMKRQVEKITQTYGSKVCENRAKQYPALISN